MSTENQHKLPGKARTDINDNKYILSHQSANVLFKFIGKMDYLKEAISEKAILPRYYEETIKYLGLRTHKKIAFPMSCFCDIHLNRLPLHMDFYGGFGIGLDKSWGIKEGVQPIQYINPNSSLNSDYKYIFNESLEVNSKDSLLNSYRNYLLTQLKFMKPLEGYMLRDGKYEDKNFHDEKEWRYVPYINSEITELPALVPSEQLNPSAYSAYSAGIKKCPDLWLRFEYKDIKYLIVENVDDRSELIEFLSNEIVATYDEKLMLVSKILVFNDIREDW